ncbi:MAG TPA: hypothetical protein VM100_03070, partial [Longimicrobiales bacterium]|nr:hypothetical protein [Longimicrobiales bacterium]
LVSFTITQGGGTLTQALDTTDNDGNASTSWTVGPSVGTGRVDARTTGVLTPAAFNVTIKAGPAFTINRVSDAVGSSAAGFELPDSVGVQVIDKFNNPVAASPVTFAITAGGGKVSTATKNTDDQGIARTAWTIGTAGAQTLRVTAGTLTADITGSASNCGESTLAVGQVLSLTPTEAQCVILNGTAQRYIVTVTNPTNSALSSASFKGRGAGASAAGNTTEGPAQRMALRSLSADVAREVEESFAEHKAHDNILRSNMELMERMGARRQSSNTVSGTANLSLRTQPPVVGDMIDMKIPNINNLCGTATVVRARVVYVGTKGIMLEDSANVTAGQLNDLYAGVGQEFDNVMFPILTTNFGNPLAMDAQLNNDGHIYMLFSTKINTLQGGSIAGFVSSGDFLPTSQCVGSNFAEVFYARAPTAPGAGIGNDSVGGWTRATRTVIIHEVKHITSFAEKISRGGTQSGYFAKDQWMEESSAMLAEELWGRGIFNYVPKSNVNYDQSIFCEVRPRQQSWGTKCNATMPLNIFDHFIYLYDYEADPENHSLVGQVNSNDFTFYGSGWAFLRWLIDTYVPSEGAFLKAMTADNVNPGIENLQIRTGKTFQDLLSEFSLALALDDLPGFTPSNAKYSFPSWNSRAIFAGMSADFSNQNFFTNPTPLRIRPSGFGKFSIDVSGVRGGGFSVLQISGTQSQKQLIEFKGPAGAAFPAEMRINVVRVQ